LGDVVVVTGLGAIGLFAVQMVRLSGASTVVAVDLYEKRRKTALDLGADYVLDPAEEDVGLAVRRISGRGADVAIEASGTYAALNDSIRSCRPYGKVVTVGFYGSGREALDLGADFFHNHLTMISTMEAWEATPRGYPAWTTERMFSTVVELFRAQKITSKPILDPVVSFEDSADFFNSIREDASTSIKLAVQF
jgi:threonine dehydrogenase-like Zn-dependent dehydrogenase